MKDLKSASSKMRIDACKDLGHLGAISASNVKDAVPVFIDLVKKDKDAGVRRAAATALGESDPDPSTAVPALTDALKDKSNDVRIAAATALARSAPAPRTRSRRSTTPARTRRTRR